MTAPDLTALSDDDLIGEYAGACVEGSDIGTGSSNYVMYAAQREAAHLEAELKRRLAALAPNEPRAAAIDEMTLAIRAVRYAKIEANAARNQYERNSKQWRFWNGVVQAMSAALATIAPPGPGRVVSDWNTIEIALLDMDYATMTAYQITHRIMQAIDAAAERAASGGA